MNSIFVLKRKHDFYSIITNSFDSECSTECHYGALV